MKFSATALFLAATATASNFSARCRDILVEGSTLTAVCKNRASNDVCSTLDLSACIRSNYGYLEKVTPEMGIDNETPSYVESCSECSNGESTENFLMEGGTPVMHCACRTGFGSTTMTSMIDLDTLVNNNDGILECYETAGVPCE